MLCSDPRLTYRAVPIVDKNDRLVEMITRGHLMRALEKTDDRNMTVLQAGW